MIPVYERRILERDNAGGRPNDLEAAVILTVSANCPIISISLGPYTTSTTNCQGSANNVAVDVLPVSCCVNSQDLDRLALMGPSSQSGSAAVW